MIPLCYQVDTQEALSMMSSTSLPLATLLSLCSPKRTEGSQNKLCPHCILHTPLFILIHFLRVNHLLIAPHSFNETRINNESSCIRRSHMSVGNKLLSISRAKWCFPCLHNRGAKNIGSSQSNSPSHDGFLVIDSCMSIDHDQLLDAHVLLSSLCYTPSLSPSSQVLFLILPKFSRLKPPPPHREHTKSTLPPPPPQ